MASALADIRPDLPPVMSPTELVTTLRRHESSIEEALKGEAEAVVEAILR